MAWRRENTILHPSSNLNQETSKLWIKKIIRKLLVKKTLGFGSTIYKIPIMIIIGCVDAKIDFKKYNFDASLSFYMININQHF